MANNIGDTQIGVFVSSAFCSSSTGNGDANTILKNTISQTHIFDAVYVCGNFNLVQFNTINSTSQAAIHLDDSCNVGVSGFSNTFASNTINEACTTSLVDPAVSGANTIGSNTTYNVAFDQLVSTGLASGFCAASGAPAAARRTAVVGSSGIQGRLSPANQVR